MTIQFVGELMLAFIAGILLNLTPCVLPAIPLKVRTIAYEAGSGRKQRVISATVFASGTLLFFLTLGGATAALHWTWGALFQSPIAVGVLVVVLLGFAYTTYRDVGFRVPGFAHSLRGQRYLEPFFSGLLSALLATPCTGPFLGGVLAYTITMSPAAIMSVFFAVGLGLAFPYIVLLMQPRLLNRLPKPGAWTVRVRQALSFVLLAAAVFFIQSLIPGEAGRWLWLVWLTVLIIWAIVVVTQSSGISARAIGPVVAIAGAAFIYAGGFVSTNPDTRGLVWQPMTKVTSASPRLQTWGERARPAGACCFG